MCELFAKAFHNYSRLQHHQSSVSPQSSSSIHLLTTITIIIVLWHTLVLTYIVSYYTKHTVFSLLKVSYNETNWSHNSTDCWVGGGRPSPVSTYKYKRHAWQGNLLHLDCDFATTLLCFASMGGDHFRNPFSNVRDHIVGRWWVLMAQIPKSTKRWDPETP